jgi:hypothetical protein
MIQVHRVYQRSAEKHKKLEKKDIHEEVLNI